MLKRLSNAPGFVATTLLTLLLGIGVNLSMLSLLDALIYREAPYPEAEQLLLLSRYSPQNQTQEFSAAEFLEVQEHLGPNASIAAFSRHQGALSDAARNPEHIDYVRSSPELFTTLETAPQLGRAFTSEDIARGQTDVAVISHTAWQQHFGGAPDIIGHTVRLGEESVTITGVMPAQFEWAKLWGFTQMWRPLNIFTETERERRELTLIARHDSATTSPQLEIALDTLASIQRANFPQHYEEPFRYKAEPIQIALTHRLTGQISWLLTALAGSVLLIACANLANLQLARSSERAKEFAIRLALGASRAQLLRHQLREPLVLAIIGGLLGLIAAMALNHVIANQLLVRGSTQPLALEINPPLVAAALLLALGSGLAFGLLPAWLSTRVDPNLALKSQDRGSTGSRHSRRLRHGLIITEIALALILLSGASTMQRGFTTFTDHSPGWDAEQVVSAPLPIPSTFYPTGQDRIQLFELLERELPNLPGVSAAAVSTSMPTFGYTNVRPVLNADQNPAATSMHADAFHVIVSAGYFDTLGIPLRRGRTFPADIAPSDPNVVVINTALARHLWPHEDPIGQRVASMEEGEPVWAEVIGVVGDVETVASLSEPTTRFTVYKPIVHENWSWVLLTLRSSQPAAQIEPMRKALREIAPGLILGKIATTDQLVERTLHNLRIAGNILSLFGLLGLGLATVGIYGVLAQFVSQRTREFGIRMALGARPPDIIRLVMGQGARLVGVGVVLGLGGAIALNIALHRFMPQFTEVNVFALLCVAAFLAAIALVTCFLPARRVTRVDPVIALHED